MEATDLQNRLAHLAPGETLLLPAAEIEQAFPNSRTPKNAAPPRLQWPRCIDAVSHSSDLGEPDPLHPA